MHTNYITIFNLLPTHSFYLGVYSTYPVLQSQEFPSLVSVQESHLFALALHVLH